jgi:hypothetical protein
MTPRKRYDLKTVSYRAPYEDAIKLTVREVMENDGRWCGPEFGWTALGEMAEGGRALDTEEEVWEAIDRPTLLGGMVDYWDVHPEMAPEGYADPYAILIRH